MGKVKGIRSRFTGWVLFVYTGLLRNTNLEGACLEGACLESADLRGANLSSADLSSANLRSANLRGADLEGADLEGADLEGADLRGANLRGANLRGADLGGADLEGADLEGACLESADLRSANLEGADLERTILDPRRWGHALTLVWSQACDENRSNLLRALKAKEALRGKWIKGTKMCSKAHLLGKKGVTDDFTLAWDTYGITEEQVLSYLREKFFEMAVSRV